MSRQIQEYLTSLVNKPRVYYLDLNNYLNQSNYQCPGCQQTILGKCENCNQQNRQLSGEITNLGEFSNLKGINASNHTFTNLNFLDTLPNKDKLKNVNLFGNQITEIDFAELFIKFPNLEKLNLQNNPAKATNLNNLTNQQFNQLVNGVKEQKIKINSFKGTLWMDLLEHAQKLSQEGNNQQQNAQYLQTLIGNSPVKEQVQPQNNSLLIGGLVILVISMLGAGY
jgi:uncharacterized protein YjbI with pentapeptide repeats